MKKIRCAFLVMVLISVARLTFADMKQSPLNGIAIGANGPQDATIYVQPYNLALEIRAKEIVTEMGFQWVTFKLNRPPEGSYSIKGVEVCYEIKSDAPLKTYISQTRLTDSTDPEVAWVVIDDGTDQAELGPTCYETNATSGSDFEPQGAVSLELNVVFGNIDDSIIIKNIKLLF